MEKIFVYCLGSIFYVGGPLLLIMGIYYLYLSFTNPKKESECKQWSSVEGKLTMYRLLGKKSWINNIDVRYDYSVAGQKYTGKSITLYPNTIFGRDHVEELLNKYHEGQTVTVYANPNKPKQAYLQIETGTQALYFRIWGIVNVIIGGFLAAVIFGMFAS